jgi:hypothetical protein
MLPLGGERLLKVLDHGPGLRRIATLGGRVKVEASRLRARAIGLSPHLSVPYPPASALDRRGIDKAPPSVNLRGGQSAIKFNSRVKLVVFH